MPFPNITLLYSGLLGLLLTALGIRVSLVRTRLSSFHAEGPEPRPIHFAVRAHGNATEWVPYQLLLMLLIELNGGASRWLHVAGGLLLLARSLHAFGLITRIKTSVAGAVLNWVTAVWLPVWALVLFASRQQL